MRAASFLSLVLVASLAACEPQIVDAVASATPGGGVGGSGAGTGGSSASGGTGGTGGSDETGGTGGTDETGGVGGTGDAGGMAGTAGMGGYAGGCGPEDDVDGDTFPDCVDACPYAVWKQTPGACGCEHPDQDFEDMVGCLPIRDALEHRYSFAGTTSTVRDPISGADANLVGVAAPTDGAVSLGRGQYVNLPNHLVSTLTSVTLEAWITWAGGAEWQRVFDFGDDVTMVEGDSGTGRTYLFLTPVLPEGPDGQVARVTFQGPDAKREFVLNATRPLPGGRLLHVAVTFDDATKTLALYIDGVLDAQKTRATTDIPVSLASLNDINCWLGRSQYSADANFGGSMDEFRIYSAALLPEQIALSYALGPDPEYLPDGP
jgi:hypothetical protein